MAAQRLQRAVLSALRRQCRWLVNAVDDAVGLGVRAVHLAIRILGPLLILLALFLISFVTYTFLVHAVPFLDAAGVLGQCAVTGLGLFLLLNALYNYAKSALMDPGLPPEFDTAHAELGFPTSVGVLCKPRQCKRCGRLKPERCHHCSICGRCVLKMDHHCPWLNNCVGFRNYRHFCLFLFFLGSACCFVVAVFLGSGILFEVVSWHDQEDRRDYLFSSFLICCTGLLAICILGSFHVFLVLTNQTTIEFQLNLAQRVEARKRGERYRNPYNLGLARNFQQVFGVRPCRLRWLLPWLGVPPSGDGLQFPSVNTTVVI